MGKMRSFLVLFFILMSAAMYQSKSTGTEANQTVVGLSINASKALSKSIPKTLFGIFFEEINHAGAGGLWAELVNNRGFEAGGPVAPSNIDPWSVIGNESSLIVSTERSSCFDRNKIALRMDVLCDEHNGTNKCPAGGVGIYNPGFYGMNIEQGKTYKLVLYTRSLGPINVSVSLVGSNGSTLATTNIAASNASNWTKMGAVLQATGSDSNSTLQLTTNAKGVIWFDQVSLMPEDTYKGHGFRKDLFEMMRNLTPAFTRFPGGTFVQGRWLRNAVRWKETIGAWEERSGHFNDAWGYWTDDGLGYLELLQLAEDLETLPVWVFNSGISLNDQVNTSDILPFVQEALDGIEFARGDPKSKWGSVRSAMGHPQPFDLRYVAVGNEDCEKKNYRGNYLKFYSAIKRTYPDIKIVSTCDGSSKPLDHPADMYDYHIYSNASTIFRAARKFDGVSRNGPKAFVSEYAVRGKDGSDYSLLAALAEAAFLIGLERNCDAVEMACYAPLFINTNNRRWNPSAIVFDSSRVYGTPSYWMQHFFRESNGATLLNATLQSNASNSLIASAITWKDTNKDKSYLRIKVVNFGNNSATIQLSIEGLDVNSTGATKTELTSTNVMDQNSFQMPTKVVPVKSEVDNVGKKMEIVFSPNSLTSLDLLLN